VSMQRGGLPMYGDSDDPFWIEGQPKPTRESDMAWALWYEVEPDYLKVMGIPLKRGRFFTDQDNQRSPLVAVIDESLAEKYFPGQDPIGRSIVDEFLGKPARIVGVVGHVKQWGLEEKINLQAQFYIPFQQIPERFMARAADSTGVLIRTHGVPPLALLESIRERVARINSQEMVFEPHTYDELVSRSLADKWFAMVLLGVFAGLALALSSIGIYGVISYVVGQRTHEIGIRLALGAGRKDVLKLVLGEGTKTALIGVAIGLVAAMGLTRLMASVLYGVSATDPSNVFGQLQQVFADGVQIRRHELIGRHDAALGNARRDRRNVFRARRDRGAGPLHPAPARAWSRRRRFDGTRCNGSIDRPWRPRREIGRGQQRLLRFAA
jgi:hypothetical protein